MAQNIEYRVEQLTEAIENLYNRDTLTGEDLTNLLNNLSARLEQMNAHNNSELAALILSDFKNSLEERNNILGTEFKRFEELLSGLKSGLPPEKFNEEFGKIANNINFFSNKLLEQEKLITLISQGLQQIQAMELSSNDSLNRKIEDIKNDISTFNVNFESMLNSVKASFNEFLTKSSGNPEITRILTDIDKIQNNTNAVLSALSIIDHKYKDLSDIIEKLSDNKSSEILTDLANVGITVASINELLKTLASKQDANEINNNFNIALESLEKIKQIVENSNAENKTRLEEFTFVLESKISNINMGMEFENFKDQFEFLIQSFSSNTKSLNDDVNALSAKFDDVAKSVNSTSGVLEELKEFSEYITKAKNDSEGKQTQILALIKDELDKIQNLIGSKDDAIIEEMASVKTGLDNLSSEISKVQLLIGSDFDSKTKEIKDALIGLTESLNRYASESGDKSIQDFIEHVTAFSTNFEQLSEKLQTSQQAQAMDISQTIETLSNQLVMIQKESSLQAKVRYDSFDSSLEGVKDEMASMVQTLSLIKTEVSNSVSRSLENIALPIQNALSALEGLNYNTEFRAMTITLEKTQTSLKESLSTLKQNLNEMAKDSHLEILGQINDTMPSIIDKLEILRSHIVSENNIHIENIKQSFQTLAEDIKKSVVDANEINYEALNASINELLDMITGLRDNYDAVNGELTQNIKIDLQRVSDCMNETLETFTTKSEFEFTNHKEKIDELLSKIGSYESQIIESQKSLKDEYSEKFKSLETIIESLNQDTYDKTIAALTETNVEFQEDLTKQFSGQFEFLKNRMNDITLNLSRLNENAQGKEQGTKLENLILNIKSGLDTNFEDFREELSFKVENALASEVFEAKNSENVKALSEAKIKLEQLNQQQIHNDEKILKEIVTVSDAVNSKLDAFCDINHVRNIVENLTALELKLKTLIGNNSQFFTIEQEVKNHIDATVNDVFEHLQKLKADSEKSSDVNLAKVLKELSGLKTDILSLGAIEIDLNAMVNQVTQLDYSNKELKENLKTKIEDIKDKFFEISEVQQKNADDIKDLLSEKLNEIKISKATPNSGTIEAIENVNLSLERLHNNLIEDVQESLENKNNKLSIKFEDLIREIRNAQREAEGILINDFKNVVQGLHANIDNIRNDNLNGILNKIQNLEENFSKGQNSDNTEIKNLQKSINELIENSKIQISDAISSSVSAVLDENRTSLSELSSDIRDLNTEFITLQHDIKNIKIPEMPELPAIPEFPKMPEFPDLSKIAEYVDFSRIERKLDNLKKAIEDIDFPETSQNDLTTFEKLLGTIEHKIETIENYSKKKEEKPKYSYTLLDVESDLAKMKLTLADFTEKISKKFKTGQSLSTDEINDGFARLDLKIENLTGFIAKNQKSDQKITQVLNYLGKWADDTTEAIAYISQNISEAPIAIPAPSNNSKELIMLENRFEDLMSLITKKFKQQELQIQALQEKEQSVGDSAILSARMEKMERQLNSLEKNLARLVAYVDEA